MRFQKMVAVVSLVFVAVLFMACAEKNGPMEKAGRAIDKAANKTVKAVGKATEKTGEALQKAGDKIEEKSKGGNDTTGGTK